MITANTTLTIPDGMQDVRVRILAAPTAQDWFVARQLALGTICVVLKDMTTITEPTSVYKDKLITSEHSPINTLNVVWEWVQLPSWVSVHLVRHHVGCTHFVQSQRNDRQNNYDRREAPQNAPVLHRMSANFESIINISKKRLCRKAAEETRYAWMLFLKELATYSPELVRQCVPQCVYRNGLCQEMFGQCEKGVDIEWLKEYRSLFQRGK